MKSAFVHFLFCRLQPLRPIVEEDDLTAAIGKRIVIVLFEVKMLLSGCCSIVGKENNGDQKHLFIQGIAAFGGSTTDYFDLK